MTEEQELREAMKEAYLKYLLAKDKLRQYQLKQTQSMSWEYREHD